MKIPESLTSKCEYVTAHKLGGVMFWSYSTTPPVICSQQSIACCAPLLRLPRKRSQIAITRKPHAQRRARLRSSICAVRLSDSACDISGLSRNPLRIKEAAEVGGLVVEAAVQERLVQNHSTENLAAVQVVNGGASGVPPVGVDADVAAGRTEHGIAVAEEVEAGMQLRHAALVLGLEDGEVVDTGEAEAAHGLHALERGRASRARGRLDRGRYP